MKYLKYLLIFSIPAVIGICYGLADKNGEHNIKGFLGDSPVEETVKKPILEKREVVAVENFSDLTDIMEETQGTYSLYIKSLNTNSVNEYNSDYFYDTASVFKVFVAISVMKNIEQKNISLDYFYKITPDDLEAGTGILQYEDIGTTYPVSELLSLAMKKSDNVAQNILVRAINKNYIADSTFSLENESSARKIGVFLENFYENKYISKVSRDYLLTLMEETEFDDRVNTGLTGNVKFAHKIGNWPPTNSWHDCGIIMKGNEAVVVCLMSKDTAYEDMVYVAGNVGKFAEGLLN